jgi:hypothetical protein
MLELWVYTICMPISAELIGKYVIRHLDGMPDDQREEEIEIMEAMHEVDKMHGDPKHFDAQVLSAALTNHPKEQ